MAITLFFFLSLIKKQTPLVQLLSEVLMYFVHRDCFSAFEKNFEGKEETCISFV